MPFGCLRTAVFPVVSVEPLPTTNVEADSASLEIVAIVGYAAVQLNNVRSRAKRGLVTDPMGIVAMRIGSLAVLLIIATAVLSQERAINPAFNSLKGVPIVVPIIGVFLVIWTFVLSRTAYGRHVYAVGGNTEAARRAGIPVDRIRISVFVIGSFMASIGGLQKVQPSATASNRPALSAFDRLAPALAGSGRDQIAAGLLGLLGERTLLDGKAAVTMQLRLSDGAAYLGPIPLGQIPPLY